MREDTQEMQHTEVQLGHQFLAGYLGQWIRACVQKCLIKTGSTIKMLALLAAVGAPESYFI